ncbi:MAG: hypothetical protein ACR2KQ_09900 [Actinomycetota bacterium]
MEHAAWKRAFDEGGIECPVELEKIHADESTVQAELDAVAKEIREAPAPEITDAAEMLAASEAQERLAARSAALIARRSGIGFQLRAWHVEHREQLLTDVLRPAVAAIIKEAAEDLLPTLRPYAPDYAVESVLDGTAKEHAAWKRARYLDEKFQLLLGVWVSCWQAATAHPAHAASVPGYLCPQLPGGLHAWEDSWAISRGISHPVRDGLCTELLAVAEHHGTGRYRLISPLEMVELARNVGPFEERMATAPNARPQRFVFLPHPTETAASTKRGKVALL